jgi:hypothetical protein
MNCRGLDSLKESLSETAVRDLMRWGEWFDIHSSLSGQTIIIEVLNRGGWQKLELPYEVGKVRLLMELGSKVARWVPFRNSQCCFKTLEQIGPERLRQIAEIYHQRIALGLWL